MKCAFRSRCPQSSIVVMAVFVSLAGLLWSPGGGAVPLQRECTGEIETTLLGLGIRLTDYDSLTVEAIRRDSGDDDRIVGWRAWVDLRGCDGWLVIELSGQCRVRQVYTRGDCALPVTGDTGAIAPDEAGPPRRRLSLDPLLPAPD